VLVLMLMKSCCLVGWLGRVIVSWIVWVFSRLS